MNAPMSVAVREATALAAMTETELCSVLQSSLYPGAKLESIKLVIGYCKAAGLDPMQKPVHIVPMDVKTDKKKPDGKFIYEKRDVIMPGVGLYRTQAARTEALAGISEPEFGPTKILSWSAGEHGEDKTEFEYPEWCRVTVRRIVQNRAVDFTAVEYWLENYATKERGSKIPNAMWHKRPRGQLAKCAQAQALRMGFPEMTGSAPTADEMEGKVIDADDAPPPHRTVEQPRARGEKGRDAEPVTGGEATADPAEARDGEKAAVGAEVTPENALKPGQLKVIQAKLANSALTEIDFKAKWGLPLTDANGFPNFRADQCNEILGWLQERLA